MRDKKQSGINAPRQKLTVRIPRTLYLLMRDYCRDMGGIPHTRIIERAINLYLTRERLNAMRKTV